MTMQRATCTGKGAKGHKVRKSRPRFQSKVRGKREPIPSALPALPTKSPRAQIPHMHPRHQVALAVHHGNGAGPPTMMPPSLELDAKAGRSEMRPPNQQQKNTTTDEGFHLGSNLPPQFTFGSVRANGTPPDAKHSTSIQIGTSAAALDV